MSVQTNKKAGYYGYLSFDCPENIKDHKTYQSECLEKLMK